MKGLALRFFAALRMTVLKSYIVKCTNVLHSGLGNILRKQFFSLTFPIVLLRHLLSCLKTTFVRIMELIILGVNIYWWRRDR